MSVSMQNVPGVVVSIGGGILCVKRVDKEWKTICGLSFMTIDHTKGVGKRELIAGRKVFFDLCVNGDKRFAIIRSSHEEAPERCKTLIS